MTNDGEKYEKRINWLGLGDLTTHEKAEALAIRIDGELYLCSDTQCNDCLFYSDDGNGKCHEKMEEWLKLKADPGKKEK